MRAMFATLGAAAVMAATVVSAAPALAADTGSLYASFDEVVVATNGGPGKVYNAYTIADGDVSNIKFTIDFGGVAGFATPSFPDFAPSSCAISGTIGTCELPDSVANEQLPSFALVPFKLTPTASAVDGMKAKIKVSISGSGAKTVSYAVPVTVSDGYDLVVDTQFAGAAAKPGADTDFKLSAANLGSETADNVGIVFSFGHGVVPAAFDNCEYADDSFTGGTDVLCLLDAPMAVNESYSIDLPAKIALDASPNEFTVAYIDGGFGSDLSQPTGGPGFAGVKQFAHRERSGKKLSLGAGKAVGKGDIDYEDNYSFKWWDIDTHYDIQAVGAQLEGAVGDEVSMNVGLKNNGPASLDIPMFVVKVPKWARVTWAPETCAGANSLSALPEADTESGGGYAYYECYSWDAFLGVGNSYIEEFKVKITSDSGANGMIEVAPELGTADFDSNTANDHAAITLKADDQPSLPTTGSKAGIIAGSGAALVLVGGVLLYAGRRRRRQATAI